MLRNNGLPYSNPQQRSINEEAHCMAEIAVQA